MRRTLLREDKMLKKILSIHWNDHWGLLFIWSRSDVVSWTRKSANKLDQKEKVNYMHGTSTVQLCGIVALLVFILRRRMRKANLFGETKDVMQGKLFQKCTHLLYCSGNVNTRRMLQTDMGSIFHLKKQWIILVIGNFYVNYQNYQI